MNTQNNFPSDEELNLATTHDQQLHWPKERREKALAHAEWIFTSLADQEREAYHQNAPKSDLLGRLIGKIWTSKQSQIKDFHPVRTLPTQDLFDALCVVPAYNTTAPWLVSKANSFLTQAKIFLGLLKAIRDRKESFNADQWFHFLGQKNVLGGNLIDEMTQNLRSKNFNETHKKHLELLEIIGSLPLDSDQKDTLLLSDGFDPEYKEKISPFKTHIWGMGKSHTFFSKAVSHALEKGHGEWIASHLLRAVLDAGISHNDMESFLLRKRENVNGDSYTLMQNFMLYRPVQCLHFLKTDFLSPRLLKAALEQPLPSIYNTLRRQEEKNQDLLPGGLFNTTKEMIYLVQGMSMTTEEELNEWKSLKDSDGSNILHYAAEKNILPEVSTMLRSVGLYSQDELKALCLAPDHQGIAPINIIVAKKENEGRYLDFITEWLQREMNIPAVQIRNIAVKQALHAFRDHPITTTEFLNASGLIQTPEAKKAARKFVTTPQTGYAKWVSQRLPRPTQEKG